MGSIQRMGERVRLARSHERESGVDVPGGTLRTQHDAMAQYEARRNATRRRTQGIHQAPVRTWARSARPERRRRRSPIQVAEMQGSADQWFECTSARAYHREWEIAT